MEFRILGRLEVIDGTEVVPLGGPRQRLVLAHLLLRANRRISPEQLIDDVWGASAPPAARNSLQSYVSHLRHAVGPDRLDRGSSGYVFELEPEDLDAARFEALLGDARRLANDDSAAAADAYRTALGLWRGPALDDLSGHPSLRAEISRLEELRLAATEDLLEAELALGRDRELVPELQALVSRYPLREGLWAKLMLALYAADRQAEALDAYRRARGALADELGLDPSPELQRLHTRILRHDPELESNAVDATRFRPALVGRDPELATMSDALEPLKGGRGAVIAITGEPGIGKSRLVAELEERSAGDVRFLVGHAVSYAGTIPYWPVREQLRSWLGCGTSSPEALVRAQLREKLGGALAGEADEAYPFLATLLGLTLQAPHEKRIRDLARDAVRAETVHWVYRLVAALARERPLCLVLEDLHWCDDTTLSLLHELLPVVEDEPVAFILVYRNGAGHAAAQLARSASRRLGGLYRLVELQPLQAADVGALAGAVVGAEAPPDLVQLLAERVGGNPYFIGEVIRDLRERGVLERESGRVRLASEASIPAALQDALQARLERLDTETRELIRTAAVIGRSFDVPLLERLLPRAPLLRTLSALDGLHLLEGSRGLPAPEYRFRHGLVEEVAYATMPEPRRRELHRRVGEALEELHRDSPAEVYGVLARHFAGAADPSRAVEYLLKAGDAARAMYADSEAAQLYRRALTFMERTGDDRHARRTLLKLALTHHLAFEFGAAGETLAEAFSHPPHESVRLEPSERVTWATTAGWPVAETAPGLTDSDFAGWITRNLFRGLVAIGPDFGIEPDLAERFTVSNDGRSYRFTLRTDARWSDGASVTADDFVFTFARMVEDGTPSAYWLDGVAADALGDSVLEIRLREPHNHFLYMLGQPALFPWPRHVYARRGRDWHRDVPLVGNGPFVLTQRSAGRDARSRGRITLRAAPRWYGSRGNVEEVTVELEPSPDAAGDRWRRGDYDMMYEVLAALAGDITTDTTVAERTSGGFTDYLGLDATRSPFDDARVRKAAAHAIDRNRVARTLGGPPASTGGLLPPAMPAHSTRVAAPFDPERARSLLVEAGHADGRGLDEIVLAHFGIWDEAGVEIAAQLAEVGFRVRREPSYSSHDLDAAARGSAHAYIWSWDYDVPDPGRGFLEPLLGWAAWLYRDEQLEQLLARAASLPEADARLAAYREFERIWIGEQAAVVPLVYNDHILWRRPWVTGMWTNAIARSTFADAVVHRRGPRTEADDPR